MVYLMGDVQGCDAALGALLDDIAFSPSRDHLVVLGDLVNRGPASLAVLRRLHALGNAATCLLGNHDLHFLAVAYGVRAAHASDTLGEILDSPERAMWIEWLRARPLACRVEGWLCVHAGVLPQWDGATTLALAAEVQALLAGRELHDFLPQMYGNEPRTWHDALAGADRARLVINALTRLRFCTGEGSMDFKTKDGAGAAPPGHHAWFEVPGRRSQGERIAFGHWSTLGLVDRPDLLALDTGCVWGGALSVARVDGGRRDVVQRACAAPARAGT
jgi:bis(5'-nucleosyl)-tetraphosphatase (symmetrical)